MNTTNNASSKLYQEGNYTCVATSKYGTDVKHFVITAVINHTRPSAEKCLDKT